MKNTQILSLLQPRTREVTTNQPKSQPTNQTKPIKSTNQPIKTTTQPTNQLNQASNQPN
jgi:hypothetical protein